ncbi:hypothetical protein GCM10007916_19410 [Psychromonas marina]|uniref:Uncharacterized protein n=1 Tax=Psychromonas marina TaxID=88364 RepID=A0ABQ6E0B0_9GAMM|nr:hypothetical protein [Psychromonas marina]GLS90874.1 hypothetical protein GCM10007916_19410 [Psychromonas marina]
MLKLLTLILLMSISFISYAAEATITAGTTIKTRLAEPIDSRVRSTGYRFRITVDSDIERQGKVIIKAGSKAQAMITHMQKSGKGLAPPAIVVALATLTINNRRINVESFQTAGKGTSSERKEIGEIDENENLVIGKRGEQITTTIPVITKGYDLMLNEGTVIYFILKEPIVL